jgi:hypothetical protein
MRGFSAGVMELVHVPDSQWQFAAIAVEASLRSKLSQQGWRPEPKSGAGLKYQDLPG